MKGFEQPKHEEVEGVVDTSFIDLAEGRLNQPLEKSVDTQEAVQQAGAARAEVGEQGAWVAQQEAADADAAAALVKKIQAGDMSAPKIATPVFDETAFEDASAINRAIRRRERSGKPMAAADLERLRNASGEAIQRKAGNIRLNEELDRLYRESSKGDSTPKKANGPEKVSQDPKRATVQDAAFEYVSKIPKNERVLLPQLSVNDPQSFERVLGMKKMANEEARKKIWYSSLAAATTSMVGGVGAIGIGGSGSAAAFYGGVALLGGGGGFLALGALGYGAKKLYDMYKERQAEKNFMKASGRE